MKRARVAVLVLLALAGVAYVSMCEGWVPTPEFLAEGKGRGEGEPPTLADLDVEPADPHAGELRGAPASEKPRPDGATGPAPAPAAATEASKADLAALAGTVVGVDGRPIANAKVTMKGGGGVEASGTTDAEGRFRIDAPVGRYDVRIAAGRDGVLFVAGVVVDGRALEGTFQLTVPAAVTVEVSEDGRALGGFPVTLRDGEDAAARVLETGVTDGSGRARFEGLVAGTVVAFATGGAPAIVLRRKAVLQGGDDLTVGLAVPPRVPWSGVVRDAATLGGVTASIVVGVDLADGLRVETEGVTDGVGNFALLVPQGKPARLEVRSPDHETFPSPKENGAALAAIAGIRSGPVVHDVLVRRGASVTGTAKGADGHGVANLELRFRPDRGAEQAVTTGPDGAYEIRTLSAGGHAVLVATPGWYLKAPRVRVVVPGPTQTGPGSLVLDVDVISAGVVSGTVVLADGAPAGQARVWLVGGRGVVRGARNTGRVLETFSASDGTFSIDDVPPVDGVRVRATWGDAEATPSDPLALAAGSPAPVRLVLAPTVRLLGRVTDLRTGAPVAGAQVSAEPVGDGPWRGRASATTNAEGRYELANRIPGRWRLIVNKRNAYLPGEPTELDLDAAVSPFTADLTLDPGLPIAGVVVDGEGKALPGVRLALAGAEDGAPSGSTVARGGGTDRGGAFRWTALRSGRYTLTLTRKGYAPLAVPLRGGEDRLRLVLEGVAKN